MIKCGLTHMKQTEKKRTPQKHLILLTNDDGFYAEGILTLRQHLEDLADIFIVAPDREKSATSLSLTLHRPLRVKKIKRDTFAVDGTPADCVYLAVQKLLPRKPSLLISGLNHGPNLGQQDISYSGTVAGARQGAFLAIPSVAISVLHDQDKRYAFEFSARVASDLARKLLDHKLPQGISLNVNIPPPPIKGIKVAKLGQKRYSPKIIRKKDPRQEPYYWIGTGTPRTIGDKNSDVNVIKKGYITFTPLQTDLTDHPSLNLDSLKDLRLSWNIQAKSRP